jgi:hypothetical protein
MGVTGAEFGGRLLLVVDWGWPATGADPDVCAGGYMPAGALARGTDAAE